jgi:arylsulfatase A-like enzyme
MTPAGTISALIPGGGMALGHPTPNVDRMAKEGAVFTSWYGQASCTAGRASFMTGRIPIRSALSIVVAPGDENYLRPGDTDHRRILQEERLLNLFFRQVAYGRHSGLYPTRPIMASTR